MQQYQNKIESTILELKQLKEVLGSNNYIHDKDLFAYENKIEQIIDIVNEIRYNDIKKKEYEKSWIL